jgi:putative membrane-bound dehydrogenase-like protein
MPRLRPFLLATLAGLSLTPALLLGQQGDPPRPLKVLFLGDRGHHRPADRAAQLVPVMHDRGIEVTYTEDVNALNPETLAGYDALIVYANIDRIEPAQEKALLDYVAGGGGFVPLHCASYCFRNSEAYVKLVGAQFQRHGTGEFETKTVDAQHPITRGLEPFKTWDETYHHTKHNEADRHVLQVRAEGDRDEPWTWVRTHGKGRVFYTAYGHDGRTWGQPGFHDLVERGIRWAANKGDVADHRPKPRAALAPFSYDNAGADIPQYLPGQRWGTQGEPITTMQRPLAPGESRKHLVVPKGFEAKLFAAEPDIAKPLCMAWDHRGRLWIAESSDYPNNLKPLGEGDDRIKVCEDTDGDGRADKFTVFADKLSIPTSIAFTRGGVVVFQAPHTLFLKDNDGDGKADERRVLFTGWGTRDTHAGPSNLRYGLDNWLYGIVGYSGFRGEVGGERHQFLQGFYRFKPDGSKLEFLRSTNNNSWGVGFTEEGLLFGSTANGCPSVYVPIPNRYYEAVRGWSPTVLESIASWNRFYPVTDKVRQVDWFGGFTAGAGHAIYTARTYPPHYWNRTAFVAEPTGHLAATFLLEKNGTDFTSDNSWNLVASDDEWTAPTMAEVGPDGHVWVIDWYNFIVQHNPTPQGFTTGKGNAYETPLRDKTHGRIYRIVSTDAPPPKPFALDPDDPKGLVAALKNDNMLWRLHAQRLLVERGKRDVVPDLVKLVGDRTVDAIGLNPGAIHALWTLHGLGVLDGSDPTTRNEAAIAAAFHPSAGVRRNAVQVLPRGAASNSAAVCGMLLNDPEPLVRLSALLALSEMPPSEELSRTLAFKLLRGSAERDRWLGDAVTAAAAAHALPFLEAIAAEKSGTTPGPVAAQVVNRVAEHYARGGPADTVGSLLIKLGSADPRVLDAVLTGLVRGWPKDRPAKFSDAGIKAFIALLPKLSTEARVSLASLTEKWGSEGFAKYTAEIAASMLAEARDGSKPDAERASAARQFVELRKADPEAAREVLAMVTPRTPPALAPGLIAAVARSESAEAGAALIEALPTLTPAARAEAVRAVVSRHDWASAFLKAVEQGKARLDDLSLDQKQALAAHPNPALAERARQLLAKGGGLPDPDRQKVIDALSAEVLKPGNAANGKLVFAQQCAKCHRHNGEGGKVGPDLTGMAAHPKADLLVHVLDPSRSVEGNFVSYTVATADGRTLTGLLASETKTAVELLDAEGKSQRLLREDIDELIASKKSLMPDGFEKQLSPGQLADLLEFLTQRGKYMPLDLRKVATVASDRGMFTDRESSVERLVFPDWSPKTFEGVPFVLLDPQDGRLPNVILLHSPSGVFPPRMPRSVSLPCNAPARVIHLLSGVAGWGYNGSGERPQTVSMIVRLHYADGATEDHPLRDGVEFADYVRRIDVPGSTFAFPLRDQQIRYLAVRPKREATIQTIDLIKGRDRTAPVVMAVTVEPPE